MATTAADGGYTPASADRSIKPRRGLPNGRAVVGALLVTVAAVGAFAAARSGGNGPETAYLVLTRDVHAGTPISLDDVSLVPMLLPRAAAANAVSSPARVEGATAVRDLAAGDLLSTRGLIIGPSIDGEPLGAVHEITLPVPRHRMAARTSAGDRVTVLSTLTLGGLDYTVTAAEDALVLEWVEDGSGSGVLTLALEDADLVAETAHLALRGELTVARSTRAVADEYPAYYTVVAPADDDRAGRAGTTPGGLGPEPTGFEGTEALPPEGIPLGRLRPDLDVPPVIGSHG